MYRIVLGVSIPDGMGGSAKSCSALHGLVLSAYPDRAVACTVELEVTQIRQLLKHLIWLRIHTTYGGNIVAVCFGRLAFDTPMSSVTPSAVLGLCKLGWLPRNQPDKTEETEQIEHTGQTEQTSKQSKQSKQAPLKKML